jgi:hypothetical protein
MNLAIQSLTMTLMMRQRMYPPTYLEAGATYCALGCGTDGDPAWSGLIRDVAVEPDGCGQVQGGFVLPVVVGERGERAAGST